MIYSHFSKRDNDQQNHWGKWGARHFQTHPYLVFTARTFAKTGVLVASSSIAQCRFATFPKCFDAGKISLRTTGRCLCLFFFWRVEYLYKFYISFPSMKLRGRLGKVFLNFRGEILFSGWSPFGTFPQMRTKNAHPSTLLGCEHLVCVGFVG